MQQINVQYSMLVEYCLIFTPNPTKDIFRVLIVKFELIVRIIAVNMMKNRICSAE